MSGSHQWMTARQAAGATALRAVVARRIRYWARRRGLTLYGVADLAGVSRSQLFNVLGGNNAATLDWLTEVARALDIGVHELLRERGRRR